MDPSPDASPIVPPTDVRTPNPFEVTTAELPPQSPRPNQWVSPGILMIWLMLAPAVLSNAIFWGFVLLESQFSTFGFGMILGLFLLIPAVGCLYGGLVGWALYRASGYQMTFAHPVVQFFFQPFWFFFAMTSGCLVAIPISALF